jgi:tryptophan 2,3-dioxygenase
VDTRITYPSYLRLPVLLDQQHGAGPPGAHDEILFIAMHQVYELWFKVLLIELADARDRMLAGEARVPRLRLHRCHEIERLLVQQFGVLDTMTPQGFAEFRSALGSASGGQSVQFMEIETLSGATCPRWASGPDWLAPGDLDRLRSRQHEPSLWDGYLALLAHTGFDVSTPERRRAAYVQIASGRTDDEALWMVRELTEALVDHDQAWSTWRARHALAVERQIGARPGTAGSTGGSYLWSRVSARFYPELWEARGDLSVAAEMAPPIAQQRQHRPHRPPPRQQPRRPRRPRRSRNG